MYNYLNWFVKLMFSWCFSRAQALPMVYMDRSIQDKNKSQSLIRSEMYRTFKSTAFVIALKGILKTNKMEERKRDLVNCNHIAPKIHYFDAYLC